MGHDARAADERKMLGVSFKAAARRGRMPRWVLLRQRAVDALMKWSPGFELRVYERLSKIIESNEPELIITHSAWIPPKIIERLKRRTGARIACWFPDHPGNLGRQYLFASCYDALFFKDKHLVEMGRRIGRKTFYLPECCEPLWHRKIALTPEERKIYECDVTIAGNLYYYRAVIFETFMGKYRVKIWGPPPPKWLDSPVREVHGNRAVTELEKAKAFNAAKVVVNTFQGEVAGVNLRTFEAAGCGAFQICEYRKELEELFVPGEEIVVFTSLKDLLDKLEYYLSREEERGEIAERGQRRAHRDHTYERRLTEMLEIVGGT